jgi:hypothetical protein
MDSEGKFWFSIMAVVSLCFIVLVAGVTVGTIQTTKMYYSSLNKCIDAGGVWLPTSMGGCSK